MWKSPLGPSGAFLRASDSASELWMKHFTIFLDPPTTCPNCSATDGEKEPSEKKNSYNSNRALSR